MTDPWTTLAMIAAPRREDFDALLRWAQFWEVISLDFDPATREVVCSVMVPQLVHPVGVSIREVMPRAPSENVSAGVNERE